MDTKQIELVQASFELVRPMANQAAEIFYRRLFEIAPHYRSLFKHDMKKQGAMLMSTLGLAVGSLNNLEAILPAVRSQGSLGGSLHHTCRCYDRSLRSSPGVNCSFLSILVRWTRRPFDTNSKDPAVNSPEGI